MSLVSESEIGKCTFSSLRDKEVICTSTGARLGLVSDAEFDAATGTIKALIVPGKLKYLGIKREKEIRIPWSAIKRIGSDLILVQFVEET